jgi:hypothetical protein
MQMMDIYGVRWWESTKKYKMKNEEQQYMKL